jgi:hypothetical protein
MKNIYQFACIAIAALMLISGCKEEEQRPLPADAGAISGATENVCPAKTVDLSIRAVAEATAYVWYRNGEVISGASGASYTASQSGSYTVAGQNEMGEGGKSPVHGVTISPCPGEEGAVPAAAGTIMGPAENDCPSNLAVLSVEAIEGATSYSWRIAYAEDDIDEAVTTEPAYTATFAGLAEGQSVTYTVSGVNEEGPGVASPPHVVQKQLCIASKPVIQGNADWLTETRGDTTVYTTVCPATQMAGTATSASENVIRYKWYHQVVGSDPELTPWATDGSAIMSLGGPGYTYNYAVVAVTDDGDSPMSDVIQVIGTQCCMPGPPGGTVAIFPAASGFYPGQDGRAYSFGINNCEIQEKTGKVETTVGLICNSAQPREGHPVLGYAFWVKTTESGSFTKVKETGTNAAERVIEVDGTTYPSGTYMVTAYSDCGHSSFGNNWIAVTIRNDCPPPVVVLPALTFSGGGYSSGTVTNTCPAATATLYMDIPGGSSGATFTWRDVSNPDEVAWDGTTDSRRDLTIADNGTYTVTYTKEIEEVLVESQPATLVVNMKLCAPTFVTKPTAIVEPAEYAEVVLNAPVATVAPHITGYEWFFGGRLALDTEVSTIDAPSSLTFYLKKEGTYKVRAKSPYGNSEFSEEITITKITPPEAYTRADLIGTYTVTDYGRAALSSFTYTLTIGEGTHADSITITNLANVVGTGNYPIILKAAVAFTADGATSGIYGTISIPKQSYVLPSGAYTYTFQHVTNETNPPTYDNNDVVIQIKFVNGKPGVSQTNLRYYLGRSSGINYCYGGGANNTVTWIKQ